MTSIRKSWVMVTSYLCHAYGSINLSSWSLVNFVKEIRNARCPLHLHKTAATPTKNTSEFSVAFLYFIISFIMIHILSEFFSTYEQKNI